MTGQARAFLQDLRKFEEVAVIKKSGPPHHARILTTVGWISNSALEEISDQLWTEPRIIKNDDDEVIAHKLIIRFKTDADRLVEKELEEKAKKKQEDESESKSVSPSASDQLSSAADRAKGSVEANGEADTVKK